MPTQCNATTLDFQDFNRRKIVARFDGGRLSSDAGGLLLREVEQVTGILRQFADCFTDRRDPDRIEHSVYDLVAQRVYGLALGYEDLNDHDRLRHDPLLALLVGKDDPTGASRKAGRDRGKALAGKSTLNRLELTSEGAATDRYKKIEMHADAVQRLFVEVFLQAHDTPPPEIVLDLDATDDPLHGRQEGRFFHGYYDAYCYLPLYIFCGQHLLAATLRTADVDGAAGSVEHLERLVGRIRQAWPETSIVVRGDSGFCREDLMNWCESNGVDYVLGLSRNPRLERMIEEPMAAARAEHKRTGEPARAFAELEYSTRDSWSRSRRVVAKAEYIDKENARFVVTTLAASARTLYEDTYCARGEMENRIKEQQLYLFADRTSAATMRANQTRLWFSSVAYLLMHALRRLGLTGTDLARAQCVTIREKLLKVAARVRITVRKVWVSLSECCPYADLMARICDNLRRHRPLRC